MFRWCAYCQTLIAEEPPLTSYRITHGMCARCSVRAASGDDPIAQSRAAIELFRALFAAAHVGDRSACAGIVARARELGCSGHDLLVGLLQPALVEIGERWEHGEVTVADEHRFTAWCSAMLAFVGPAPPAADPLDLVILMAPGNRHELGPRVAEQALLEHGLQVLTVVPELPIEDAAALLAARRTRWVGFSCALAAHVEDALDAADALFAHGFRGGVILSGQALRRTPTLPRASRAVVCLTITDAVATLRSAQA